MATLKRQPAFALFQHTVANSLAQVGGGMMRVHNGNDTGQGRSAKLFEQRVNMLCNAVDVVVSVDLPEPRGVHVAVLKLVQFDLVYTAAAPSIAEDKISIGIRLRVPQRNRPDDARFKVSFLFPPGVAYMDKSSGQVPRAVAVCVKLLQDNRLLVDASMERVCQIRNPSINRATIHDDRRKVNSLSARNHSKWTVSPQQSTTDSSI